MSRNTHIRSPSKLRLSTIQKNQNNDISITPDEIDEIIMKWYDVKIESKKLNEKEKKYKDIIQRIMDLTNNNVIKGKDLSVIRKFQKRKFISRENLPSDIFNEYSIEKSISMMYIKEN